MLSDMIKQLIGRGIEVANDDGITTENIDEAIESLNEKVIFLIEEELTDMGYDAQEKRNILARILVLAMAASIVENMGM